MIFLLNLRNTCPPKRLELGGLNFYQWFSSLAQPEIILNEHIFKFIPLKSWGVEKGLFSNGRSLHRDIILQLGQPCLISTLMDSMSFRNT